MPRFDTQERMTVNHPLYLTATRDSDGWGGMSRFGVGSLLAVLGLICALVLTPPPALASASATSAHKRRPTAHRVGGTVHKAWPRSHSKPPRTALARWLARQVGPTKARACTKRVHGKVIKCRRKKPPRMGAPLPGGQLGGPKSHAHATGATEAFMRLGQDTNPIAYAASSSVSSTSSTSSGSSDLQLVRSY